MTENLKKGFEFEPELVITTSNDKSEATVSVCNSGPGIPAEIQDKIFQPFFTTKSPGSGTGLGLSISYDIITKGHGGKLFFTSDSNRTCFIFTLPYQN
jgi:signal transduction histidine kinase